MSDLAIGQLGSSRQTGVVPAPARAWLAMGFDDTQLVGMSVMLVLVDVHLP